MTTLAEYSLRIIPGFVRNNYMWIARQGDPNLSCDDLAQVALIAAIELLEKWDTVRPADAGGDADDEATCRAFFGYLKPRIQAAIYDVSAATTHDRRAYTYSSFDEPGMLEEGGENRLVQRTSIAVHQSPSVLHSDIVDYFSTLPARDKAVLALRFFDGLSFTQIAILTGYTEGSVATFERLSRNTVRAYARNQVAEFPEEITPRRVVGWTPPDELARYLQRRYGTDLPGYLGWVTNCFRVDVAYVAELVATGSHFFAAGSKADLKVTAEMHEEIIRRDAAGESWASIGRDLGLTHHTVGKHVRRAS
ncbi:MAG: sigma-70 family RNA polymerase sigma factor [Microbacterium sp.]